MDLVLVALIAACSPLLLAHLTNRQRRSDKREDWARSDAVAEKAAEAARLLLAANERVAETTAVTNEKLDVIHGLVNSQMTAAIQAELGATERELVLLRRLAAIAAPDDEVQAAEATATAKIAELRATLADRLQSS